MYLSGHNIDFAGYRDDSLETVKRNEQQYKIPLEVVSYKQLYGWTMDEIVKEIGTKNNCTFCGVFRRQALDRGATMMKVSASNRWTNPHQICIQAIHASAAEHTSAGMRAKRAKC